MYTGSQSKLGWAGRCASKSSNHLQFQNNKIQFFLPHKRSSLLSTDLNIFEFELTFQDKRLYIPT